MDYNWFVFVRPKKWLSSNAYKHTNQTNKEGIKNYARQVAAAVGVAACVGLTGPGVVAQEISAPLGLDALDMLRIEAGLIRAREHPSRTLVGLELEGNETAAHGDCVHVGRSQVGVVTSATRSPLLSKNIALCRMAVEHAELGTKVEVGKLDGHQKRIPATVVRFPFYDPDKTRVRA